MDDVISLLTLEKTQGTDGVWRSELTPREVFCQISSVTRAEFYQAGRNGLNPQFVATVFAGDYQGESLCVYDGKSYAIYRTYHVPGTDYIELYIQREGGTNGKQASSP